MYCYQLSIFDFIVVVSTQMLYAHIFITFVIESECAEHNTAVDFLSVRLSHTAVVLKLLAFKLHDFYKAIAFHNIFVWSLWAIHFIRGIEWEYG